MNGSRPTIVSVSRRTDIPAFYGEWFQDRLEAGSVSYRNPFNQRQTSHVSLLPRDILGFVFWSKNFCPFLPVLRRMEDSHGCVPLLFQYTITGYDRDLEPGVAPLADRLRALNEILTMRPGQAVFWRYDTVILTDRYTTSWHRTNFRKLCEGLAGRVDRCIISFLRVHGRVGSNLRAVRYQPLEPGQETEFAQELAEIAGRSGLSVWACCQDHLCGGSIRPSACIDGDSFRAMDPVRLPTPPPVRGTRRQCRCAASRDIGAYDTCGHGCRYCYAVSDHEQVDRALTARHGAFLQGAGTIKNS